MKWNEGYFRALGHSPEVTAIVAGIAEDVAGIARAGALVDTGAYRDSIHVEIESTAARNVAKVVASDPKSLFLESETGNLARALNQVKQGG